MIFETLMEMRSANAHPREAGGPFWGSSGESATGMDVNEWSSLGNSAVMQAVMIRSSMPASMPLKTFKRDAKGNATAHRDHHLWRLLHDQPNPEMTAFSFLQTQLLCKLLYGNSYAEIERDREQQPVALWHLPSWLVTPRRVYRRRGSGTPTFNVLEATTQEQRKGGTIVYEVRGTSAGGSVYLLSDDMFHVPGLSFNGLKGFSPIRVAMETIAVGLAMQKSAASIFGNSGAPGGVLERPDSAPELTPTGEQNLINAFEARHLGVGKRGRIAILQEGTKFSPVHLPLNELQFIQNLKNQVPEVARMWNISPYFLGYDGSQNTYTNVESEWTRLITQTLLPDLRGIEQEIYRKLISEPDAKADIYAEFEVNGLLRGDTAARGTFYRTLWDLKAITPGEIARRENLPPVPEDQGGETYKQASPAPTSIPAAPEAPPPNRTALMLRERLEAMLEAALQRVVAREERELRAVAGKYARPDLDHRLDDIYRDLQPFIVEKVRPALGDRAERFADLYALRHHRETREALDTGKATMLTLTETWQRDTARNEARREISRLLGDDLEEPNS